MTAAPYRLFDATVLDVSRPSPGFIRIVFGGADLDRFGFAGLDQRIKLMLPNDRGEIPRISEGDDWYRSWAALPDGERPPMRTYTPTRLVRDDEGTRITVDFARHDLEPGPASAWALAAARGDALVLLGPDAGFAGPNRAVGWIPPRGASRFLLVGDETALPAMAGIVASLDAVSRARVIVEVADAADAELLELGEREHRERIDVDVRVRGGSDAPGAALVRAVRELDEVFPGRDGDPRPAASPGPARAEAGETDGRLREIDVDREILWEVPGIDESTGAPLADDARSSSGYAWLAGEAGAIKAIRRHLVAERGVDRQSVAFMGYWRAGRAEN